MSQNSEKNVMTKLNVTKLPSTHLKCQKCQQAVLLAIK